MTDNELLDKILDSYLHSEKLSQDNDSMYRKMTFDSVIKTHEPTVDSWRIEFLKSKLFNDNFLTKAKTSRGEPFRLTSLGVEAAQTNWYSSLAAGKQKEDDIKDNTLVEFKRSKYSLIIAILSFIISTFISLYTLWVNKQQPTKAEVQVLHQRIQKLELENFNSP